MPRRLFPFLAATALLMISPGVAAADPSGPPVLDCKASWYGVEGQPDRMTAYGEKFDRLALTTGARDWGHNTLLRVTWTGAEKSVQVRVNDFSPNAEAHPDRCVNLTWAAFGALAPQSAGVLPVRVERLN
ncbi:MULTISPECIES: septal ring lytic transglycosylase RlpA family protein [unclassified Crossiella]|uniref:septal ring lytic transglycosylase RlpA family protein n=1 Tax=unclassified Crossiella TaxID=2620835 RepID=UPI001FFE8C9B|nr:MULTISPECIES: septal ring lytic transglycosylase RlpA family protein [unclassified Crossiella]MCK2239472.1 septal ring lytic transglycosylase RlpA family protein [Crossiella sp. S99.2]MCK2252167.1 septal ring lytic transglycosylase RlpA family protein [Crossiella sp. S99.1]